MASDSANTSAECNHKTEHRLQLFLKISRPRLLPILHSLPLGIRQIQQIQIMGILLEKRERERWGGGGGGLKLYKKLNNTVAINALSLHRMNHCIENY